MRKFMAVAAAVLLASGCSPVVVQKETVRETVQETVTAQPAPESISDDEVFIMAMDEVKSDWRDYGSRSEAIELGTGVCSTFDDYSMAESMDMLEQAADDNTDLMAAVIVSAITAYCPEHESDAQEWAARN